MNKTYIILGVAALGAIGFLIYKSRQQKQVESDSLALAGLLSKPKHVTIAPPAQATGALAISTGVVRIGNTLKTQDAALYPPVVPDGYIPGAALLGARKLDTLRREADAMMAKKAGSIFK